jgi:hypothetical protein
MHPKQKLIISRLVFDNGLKYSHLAQDFEYEDKLPYHLKQLLKYEYISKKEDWYHLTTKGLKFSASFNLNTLEDRMDQVAYIGLICEYKGKYLLHKKIAEPAFSWYELIGGRPYAGEPLEEACKRILHCETSISSRFIYNSLHHRTLLTKSDEILFDNALMIFDVKLNDDEFEKLQLAPNNFWFSVEEIESIENKYPEIDICVLKKDWKPFCEYEFVSGF